MTDNRNTEARVLAGVMLTSTERLTQSQVLVGVTLTPPARNTQAQVLAGVALNPPERVTQSQVLAAYGAEPPVHLTQSQVLVGIQILTPPCHTQEADLWKITREDGTVFRFTSHDRRMTFRGEVYTPCGSLTPSALQLSAELGATDNLDLSGIVYEGGIEEADLWAGKFNGAEIEVWRVPWGGSTSAVLVASGTCGSLQFQDSEYKFEIVTAGARLQQRPILQPVMPTCRFKFGDSRCTKDLGPLTVTGSVTGVVTPNVFSAAKRRVFNDSTRVEADGTYTLGRLLWTSGDNNGIGVDVKSFAATQFILEQPMPAPIQLGDTYSLTPGCARTTDACNSFANIINFGGFPYVRGTDDMNETPEQDI